MVNFHKFNYSKEHFNLIKSIDFGRKLIIGKERLTSIQNQKFKLTLEPNPNSRFEYEIQVNDRMYAYGFIISKKAIVEEWLYLVTPKKETLIFERLNDEITVNQEKIKQYSDTEKDFWNFFVNSVKSDKLILTHASQLEINKDFSSLDDIRNILNWFKYNRSSSN